MSVVLKNFAYRLPACKYAKKVSTQRPERIRVVEIADQIMVVLPGYQVAEWESVISVYENGIKQ